jgi:hypothetical protein
MNTQRIFILTARFAIIILLAGAVQVSAAQQKIQAAKSITVPEAKFSQAVAFDESAPLRELSAQRMFPQEARRQYDGEPVEILPDRSPQVVDRGFTGDGAIQKTPTGMPASPSGLTALDIPAPIMNFEGLSNQDNFDIFGYRVNPPSPSGDVGPSHYVEAVKLAFAVYNKQGSRLLGPVPNGALWEGFAVEDCRDPTGDPIVLYDQFSDRWLLSQFTAGIPTRYSCVAVSQTGDPTGAYYRYAFTSGEFLPAYPKYGVWSGMYLLTTCDFGPTVEYGISVYALEKSKMLTGDPTARIIHFFLDSTVIPPSMIGDGLLPADVDGRRAPANNTPAPMVGTQDDDGPYDAQFDALNIWELSVDWDRDWAALSLVAQLPVAEFDSLFPCAPTSRDCLPQPGIIDQNQYLDILSYRQRPTWRLAYRNFGNYEALVTTQSVEARPSVAGMRWYEIRRAAGVYSLHQQGTYSPDEAVHRWMGSIAMDRVGNIALGYSVVNGAAVYPGIRYTGRAFDAPLGQMDLGEGVIINGSGVQTTIYSYWGEYSSMNVDPEDDCTFWYVNEYYTADGQASSTAGWQTRIASFKLPGCEVRTYLPLVKNSR